MTIPPHLAHCMRIDILNSREWAVLFWTIAFLYYFLFIKLNDSVFDSLVSLFKATFNVKILIPVVLMATYIYCAVQCLQKIGLWSPDQLKNTIVWTATVGPASLMRISTTNIEHPFRTILLDNFKIIAILEFITNIQSFNIFLEMMIVPVVALLVVTSEISKRRKDTVVVYKLSTALLSITGVWVLVKSLLSVITNFTQYAEIKTIYDFSIPPILTTIYIPFLFILATIINYEYVFAILQFKIKDEKIAKFAKKHVIKKFVFRTNLLKRWWKTLNPENIKTTEDIKSSVQEILDSAKAERNPQVIDFTDGWSPHVAKKFLKKHNVTTGFYDRSISGEWYAESSFISISEGIEANKIYYRIEGNKEIAKHLKLKLHIDYSDTANGDLEIFLLYCKELAKKAMNLELPQNLQRAITKVDNYSYNMNYYVLNIKKGEWFNVNRDGYVLSVTISHYTWNNEDPNR